MPLVQQQFVQGSVQGSRTLYKQGVLKVVPLFLEGPLWKNFVQGCGGTLYKLLEPLIFKLLSIAESPFLLERLYVPFVYKIRQR